MAMVWGPCPCPAPAGSGSGASAARRGGDEEPGLRQGVDDLQLLLAGVAGDVEGARRSR